MFADLVLVGRFKVMILARHSQFCVKFLLIMDKVAVIWVLFTLVMTRPVLGRIYFEGMKFPPDSEEDTKPTHEVANPSYGNQHNSAQTQYQPGQKVQTDGNLSGVNNRHTSAASNHPSTSGANNHQPTAPSRYSPESRPLPSGYQSTVTPINPPSPFANLHQILAKPNSADPNELALKDALLKYIGRGLTDMTLRMQKVLRGRKSNVFFAPVSIASALALLLLAAKGQTAKQISNCLGLPVGDDSTNREDETHLMLGLFFEELKSSTTNITSQLALANGIFVQTGHPIKPQFRNIVTAAYKSDAYTVDFKNKRTDPSLAINYWVANRTNGRIKSVLGEPLSPSTVAVLINAIYFNGNWQYPFFYTSPRKFYVTPYKTTLVPMMQNEMKVPFLADKEAGFKMIGLPYIGDEHIMYSVIPDGDLDTFIETLTTDRIYDMINRTVEETTIVLFPKMNLTMEIDLHTTLDQLGVKDVFIPAKADLSSLAKGVFVSKAIHKAEIDVNEVGTIASAVSFISSVRTNVNPTFVASKPFLFFIYHKTTQAITFWGTVYDPSSS